MSIAWSKKGTFLIAGVVVLGLLLGSLFFALQKPVSIGVDGKVIKTRVLFAGTVKDILEDKDIKLGKQDLVEPALNTGLKKNMRIAITRAFKIKVLADGKTQEILTTPVPIKEAVTRAGVKLGDKDIVKTLPVTMVVPGQEIEVIRVSEKNIVEEAPLPYQVERTSDPTLEKGLTKTVRAGKNGIAKNTIRITFYNGTEAKRDVVNIETVREPQNKIVAMGSITEASRGGQRFNFREARYMVASAYTYTGSRTSTGKNPAVGMVAVDPQVIPMGSRLYVEGYGYALAADRGGAIKGDRLDLFMEEEAQCLRWGRKSVKVYILQ